MDSKYAHLAWQKEIGEISYPMLSDMRKRVTRDYGILLDQGGISLRGLFIIDPGGLVRYELIHDLSVGRSVSKILRVLKALQTGNLCLVDEVSGEEIIGSS